MMFAGMARWAAFFGDIKGGDDSEGGLSGFGMIIMSFIAPIAAIIIQSTISRSREYLADSARGRFAGNNEGLASALEKLGASSDRLPTDANPSTAHMFIVNPLTGKNLMNLFSTHPLLEERIAKLRGIRPPQSTSGSTKRSDGEKGREFWGNLSE